MNALRLSAVVLSVGSILAVAILTGVAACSGDGTQVYLCNVPQPDELGADGGPDPCHCNVVDGTSCQCTTPGDGVLFFQQCQFALAMLEADGGDAGADGGP